MLIRLRRDEVYTVIDGERDYQDARQGNSARENVDDNRSLGDLILLTEIYVDKAKAAFGGPHPDGKFAALSELRKVAALAVAAMEFHGVVPRTCSVGVAKGHAST